HPLRQLRRLHFGAVEDTLADAVPLGRQLEVRDHPFVTAPDRIALDLRGILRRGGARRRATGAPCECYERDPQDEMNSEHSGASIRTNVTLDCESRPGSPRQYYGETAPRILAFGPTFPSAKNI